MNKKNLLLLALLTLIANAQETAQKTGKSFFYECVSEFY
jgi:hypothetical protein